ncbi:hypothetical protein NHX12_001201 [Muraenolepis orangiensis]|uniref:Scaffolding anchor of CK1 domain-containing protein n=1 Tax=Muraenolepis orangiensis TaxID=630683 RepID=A0A9Q0IGE3_9TELE|nr:hypothetical protein NHX12_001201 [Muraenolepis orangiensis]
MDPHGLSALSHMRAKPVGKVRRRVRELRTTTTTYYGGGGGGLPTLDLSHSESQRLAVDALLGQRGVPGYRELLAAEGEVDFLSEREKSYILTHKQDGHVWRESDTVDGADEHGGSRRDEGALSVSHISASGESPEDSQTLEDSPLLGSQDGSSPRAWSRLEGTCRTSPESKCSSSPTTGRALVIVVNMFSDVELLCDILEASTKRNVSVCLLLDSLNVQPFLDMCLELNVHGKHFPKLSVRSVAGHRYCTKTGEKLSGQITETFLISDWTQVLTGSYSFSWLSWQVDRNIIVLLTGRRVTSFHQEFRRLYLSSQPLPPLFHSAALTSTPSASHVTQHSASDPVIESMLERRRVAGDGTKGRNRSSETDADMEPMHLALSKLEVERDRAETYVINLAQYQAQTEAELPAQRNREIPRHLGLPDVNGERQKRALANSQPTDFTGLTFSRTYTHVNPHVGGKPTVVGGVLYQDLNRNSRTAMECGFANLDTLRRGQRHVSKAKPRLDVDSQPLCRPLLPHAHPQRNPRGLFISPHSQRHWLDPQNDLRRTQSCPTRSQLESGFSATGTKAAPQGPQNYNSLQLPASQRLHWMSQVAPRRPPQGANGTGGHELGQRDAKTGALSGGRTMLARPPVLHRGATLNARLKVNESRGFRGQRDF